MLLILGLVLGSIVLTMFFAVNCYDETASAFRQARVSVRDVMQDADWYGRASVGFRAAHAHAGAYCCPQAATRALEQRHAGWDRGDADQVRRCIRRYVLKVWARHRRACVSQPPLPPGRVGGSEVAARNRARETGVEVVQGERQRHN